MNWIKNFNFWKLVFKRFSLLIFLYNIFNNKSLISYIYGAIKSSWYDLTVSTVHDESCILSNPLYEQKIYMNEKCISCESLKEICRIYDTIYEEIDLNYIKRNHPVIITDAMYSWNISMSRTVNIVNVTQIYLEQMWMHNYVACDLLANLDLRTDFLLDFLVIISNPMTDSWFIYWKNCNLKATKVARNFYEQPYFIKYYLPAAKTNWILMSNRYSTKNFQEIRISGQRLALFKQLKGSFKIKLTPRQECTKICSEIDETLNESEILLINTDLWRLHYLPQTTDKSIAIITENEL